MVYFTFATLYKTALKEKLCAGALALFLRLFFGEVRNFDRYRTELYNATCALLEKARLAATAARRPVVNSS